MKSFREIVVLAESPVGKVGRTKDSEALAHIESSDVAKRFRKIVRELGGVSVATQLLNQYKLDGRKPIVVTEETELKINATYAKKKDSTDKVDIKDISPKEVTFYSLKKKRKDTLKTNIFLSQYILVEGKMPKTMSASRFLTDLGYKIKKENFDKYSFNLEFFNDKDAREAYNDLCDEGFLELYNMTKVGSIIGFEEK